MDPMYTNKKYFRNTWGYIKHIDSFFKEIYILIVFEILQCYSIIHKSVQLKFFTKIQVVMNA